VTRKPIEYDPHAIQQMRDRGITRVNVRWMLAHGARVDAEEPAQEEPRFAKQGYIGKQEMKVIYTRAAETGEVRCE
jgi:hypothetical protein